jgi:hypothetical protein
MRIPVRSPRASARSWPTLLALTILALALVLAGCSDDDDGPTDPGDGDTTAPQVVGSDPGEGEAGVDVDETVEIVFSEAMDTSSHVGEISTAPTSNASASWANDRTLRISHDDWPEGTRITVTVGTGLTDAAGNALAAPYTVSFWTETTSELLLLETVPADGAVDVNRDAAVIMVFSADVDPSTLPGNLTIEDPTKQIAYDWELVSNEDGRLIFDPQGTFPSSTVVTVTAGTGIETYTGVALSEETAISFTTGTEVDTTPPMVVAYEPPSGTMDVASDQGFFRMTFSEPVNPESLEPSRWNLAFAMLMLANDSSPTWNAAGTVMTVPLPADLPAGLPIEIEFSGIADLAGNVNPDPQAYSAQVAGTADYVPVEDGARWLLQEWYQEEELDGTPVDSGFYAYFMEVEVQSGQTYREVYYEDEGFSMADGYDEFIKTASALQWTGFDDPDKEMFDEPLDVMPLPLAAGTWTDDTTVDIAGEGSFRATLNGTVLAQTDLDLVEIDESVFIKDAWRVVHELDVEIDDDGTWVLAFTQVDTLWLAPTYGVLRHVSLEENEAENRRESTETWQLPFGVDLEDKARWWRR